jgi:MFS transporter, ACDE family, multidrug resistance protein
MPRSGYVRRMAGRRQLLVLILAVTATGIMGNTLLAPAIPDILDEFGVGVGGAGVLIAATSFPGVFMAPIIGVLADRLGRRRVLVPCLATFGVFGTAAALAPTFGWLIVARLGMGLGASGLINLSVVLIGDHWDGWDRTRLIGRNAAFLTVCLALMPPIGGVLTDLGSWRLALAPYSLGIVTAAVAWRTLPRDRPDVTASLRDQLGGIGEVVRRPEVMVVLVGGAISFVMIFGIFLSTLPIHLEQRFGYSASMRGLFLAIPAVPSTLVAFNLQRIRNVVDARQLLVGCSLAFAAGFALIGASEAAVLVMVGCVVYGLGEGALIPTLQDLSVQLSPPEHRGAVVAVYVGAARLGQTAGPLGAAALFGATSTFVALHAGVAMALGLAVLFLLGPMRRASPGRRAEPAIETAG